MTDETRTDRIPAGPPPAAISTGSGAGAGFRGGEASADEADERWAQLIRLVPGERRRRGRHRRRTGAGRGFVVPPGDDGGWVA
jgi:hypothetical protein